MSTRLALGPVLFHWQPEHWRDFYFRIADEAPVDTVYLGEVVCAKRRPFVLPHLEAVADRLAAAGKEVVRSTLALIMTDEEMAEVADALADASLTHEANDLSTAALLAGRRHVVGPFVNVYNEDTLAFLAERGAYRFSLPAEMPLDALAALAATDQARSVELEVQVFGRLPLAISARCYHARAHGLAKDGCRFVCGQDPDGLVVETLDGEPFLAINGTQTLSDSYCCLLDRLDALTAAGIGCFRLWPQRTDMVEVASLFRAVLEGTLTAEEATARLGDLVGEVSLANGFLHGREGRAWVDARAAAAE
ncbi:MAG: U32 family peptidase [Alphaproteobacteria bacterium]|jgi:collagenase-like PrtC family protease|nr:U32 family peptidase [Alphaproteobacteria bacterium]